MCLHEQFGKQFVDSFEHIVFLLSPLVNIELYVSFVFSTCLKTFLKNLGHNIFKPLPADALVNLEFRAPDEFGVIVHLQTHFYCVSSFIHFFSLCPILDLFDNCFNFATMCGPGLNLYAEI